MAKQTMFEKAIADFKSGDSFKEQARNGQHPFVTFLEELAKSGCAVELRDDDVCMFNPQKRVVALGARLGNAVLAGIGGLLRYTSEKWGILRGTLEDSTTRSTYTFCKKVLGYDLAGFFKQFSPEFKAEIDTVLRSLLSP